VKENGMARGRHSAQMVSGHDDCEYDLSLEMESGFVTRKFKPQVQGVALCIACHYLRKIGQHSAKVSPLRRTFEVDFTYLLIELF